MNKGKKKEEALCRLLLTLFSTTFVKGEHRHTTKVQEKRSDCTSSGHSVFVNVPVCLEVSANLVRVQLGCS